MMVFFTGPINRELRHLVSSYQSHNTQLKGEINRYRHKLKEAQAEVMKVSQLGNVKSFPYEIWRKAFFLWIILDPISSFLVCLIHYLSLCPSSHLWTLCFQLKSTTTLKRFRYTVSSRTLLDCTSTMHSLRSYFSNVLQTQKCRQHLFCVWCCD